jgi:hypothetical protein
MVLCGVIQLLVITIIYNLPFIFLHEKLIVAQLCRKFTQFYETQGFSPIFTTARQRTTFRVTQPTTNNSSRIPLRSITLQFLSVICSWARSDLCHSHLLIKICVHSSYTYITCLLHVSRILLCWTLSN